MLKDTLLNIGGTVSRTVEKHSPEICLGIGIASMVAATVCACKGTIKAKKAIDDAKDDMKTIAVTEENGETFDNNNNPVEYTHEDSMKDRAIVAVHAGIELAKAYGPAVILTTVGIISLLKGHNILKKRNLALVAAYESISEAYKKYQDKVKDLIGETAARNLKYGLKEEEITTDTGKKNKDGSPKLKKEKKLLFDGMASVNDLSPYARFWDSSCKEFSNNPEYDLMYLKNKQNWCNDLLRLRRNLTLNEVYRELGMEETREGCVVGWSLDSPQGDGYVDFGIFNMAYTPNRDFVNGYEPVCLLDFNVDGPIFDHYPKSKEVQDGSIQA